MSVHTPVSKLRPNLQFQHIRPVTILLFGDGEQGEELAKVSQSAKYLLYTAATASEVLRILDERLVDCLIVVAEKSAPRPAVQLIEAVRSARAGFADVPVIVTATQSDSALKSACLLAGCTAFVPSLAGKLKRTVNKVCRLDSAK